MKKICLFVVLLIIVFSFCACDRDETTLYSTDPKQEVNESTICNSIEPEQNISAESEQNNEEITTETSLSLEDEVISNAVVYTNGDTIFLPDKEKVTYDEETHSVYYNNTMTVYLLTKLSGTEKEDLAASVGGIVAGEIENMNVLQIALPKSNVADLENYASIVTQNENVLYATFLYPIDVNLDEPKDTTNNPWNDPSDIDSDSPGGNDWWAEAIDAYTAWEYSNQAGEIIVGIVDSGFDVSHEDFQRNGSTALRVINNNSVDDHGTHVAGLIAAQDNNRGIRGVADKAQIICVDWTNTFSDRASHDFTTLDFIEYIQELTAQSSKSALPIVINNSWGIPTMTKDRYTQIVYEDENKDGVGDIKYIYEYFLIHATGAYDAYLDYLEVHAKRTAAESMLMIVELLLNGKEDFLIVQSAGNGYEGKELGIESKRNGWFCGIDEELFNEIFSETSRNKLEQRGITYSSIKDHIMVVAAVDLPRKDGKYPLTAFSNYGKTVDLCAPGQSIYSTIPRDSNGNLYGKLSGTSMAAPLVTGSAALIWSLEPGLTAKQVKERICGTKVAVGVTGEDKGKEYKMLSVGEATRRIPTDYGIYLDVISRVRDISVYQSGEGYLYDFDGDGIEELFLMYCALFTNEYGDPVPYSVCSLYSIRGKQLITLMEDTKLRIQAGGGEDSIGVFRIDNKTLIGTHIFGAGDVGSGDYWKLYSLRRGNLQLIFDIEGYQSIQYYPEYKIDYENSYSRFGEDQFAYSKYEEWEKTVNTVFAIDGYDYDYVPGFTGLSYDELVRRIKEKSGKTGESGTASKEKLTEAQIITLAEQYLVDNPDATVNGACPLSPNIIGIQTENGTEYYVVGFYYWTEGMPNVSLWFSLYFNAYTGDYYWDIP